MGGPLEGGLAAWWPIFLIGAVVLLVIVVSAGLLARGISGRWSGFGLGLVAYIASAWWLRVRWGVEGELALLCGFGAAAAAGGLVAFAGRQDADRRGFALVGVWVVVVGLAVVAVATTTSHERDQEAEAALRPDAEAVAEALRRSEARTTLDLAIDSGGDVLEATGRRDDGGVQLVVRTTKRSFGQPTVTACWQYRVEGRTVEGPDPTSCPGGGAPVLASSFSDPLATAVLALPPDEQRHARSIRAAVEQGVDVAVLSGDQPTVEVGDIESDAIGVAVRFSVTHCVFVRIAPAGPDAEYRWWTADPAQLRSGTPGCHPAGAVP